MQVQLGGAGSGGGGRGMEVSLGEERQGSDSDSSRHDALLVLRGLELVQVQLGGAGSRTSAAWVRENGR